MYRECRCTSRQCPFLGTRATFRARGSKPGPGGRTHAAAQRAHGVMWEQPGPGYGPGPLGSMQARISVCHDPLDTILNALRSTQSLQAVPLVMHMCKIC